MNEKKRPPPYRRQKKEVGLAVLLERKKAELGGEKKGKESTFSGGKGPQKLLARGKEVTSFGPPGGKTREGGGRTREKNGKIFQGEEDRTWKTGLWRMGLTSIYSLGSEWLSSGGGSLQGANRSQRGKERKKERGGHHPIHERPLKCTPNKLEKREKSRRGGLAYRCPEVLFPLQGNTWKLENA